MGRFKAAFRATATAFYEANLEAIGTPHYWEGFEDSITHRKNGEAVVGAYRNILDLSNLSNSQILSISGTTATLTWDGLGLTPAVDVFFGVRSATTYIPGRNWVELALDNVDLVQMFRDEF